MRSSSCRRVRQLPDRGDGLGERQIGIEAYSRRASAFQPAASAGQGWRRAFQQSCPAGPARGADAVVGWQRSRRSCRGRNRSRFRTAAARRPPRAARPLASASARNLAMRARTSGWTTASRARSFSGRPEKLAAEFGAVDLSDPGNSGEKLPNGCRCLAFVERVHSFIGGKDGDIEIAERLEHGRFARGDRAGQAELDHRRRLD